MIIIDYSPLAIAGVMEQTKYSNDFDENLIRHIVLNQILSLKRRLTHPYGEIVLCTDHRGGSWRRDYYPYYKAQRRAQNKDSPIDWSRLLDIINMIEDELATNMPYRRLKVEKAEADDCIAILCKTYTSQEHCIVSKDKDFIQLQTMPHVTQYASAKGFIREPKPDLFLHEMIIRGDSGDGVPNIFSDDDVFVNPEKRQKSIFQKKLDVWMKEPLASFATEENIKRNRTLIDFDFIPDDLKEKIIAEFESLVPASRQKIYTYFSEKRLRAHFENINSF